MKEVQQCTMFVKGSFKHLQPINEDDPNIAINGVINKVFATTYREGDTLKTKKN